MFRNYVEGRKAPYEILDPRNPLPCTYVDVMPTEKKITLGDKCQFQYVRMSRGKKKKEKQRKSIKERWIPLQASSFHISSSAKDFASPTLKPGEYTNILCTIEFLPIILEVILTWKGEGVELLLCDSI